MAIHIPVDLLTKLCALAQALQYAKAAKALLAALCADNDEAEEVTKTARFVKSVQLGTGAWQALYQLSEPVTYDHDEKQTSFVIASAAHVDGEPETYLFAADETGRLLSWNELPGSLTDTYDHEAALNAAGFSLVK